MLPQLRITSLKSIFAIFTLCFFVAGCDFFSIPYSEEAFKQATSARAQSLALIADGDELFRQHEERADALLLNIAEAYEFARGRSKKNSNAVAAQWANILDPNGGSLADFISQWKSNGRMSSTFIEEFLEVVAWQFDAIIELETGRKITLKEEYHNG